ncbi:Peptidase family C78 domain containing protein, partial [Tylopilus felleus]
VLFDSVTSLSGNNDICQLCSTNLSGKSVRERRDHYNNEHGPGPSTSARPKLASVDTPSMKLKLKCRRSPEDASPEDVFWHPTQAKAPPDNYAPGVLSVLKEALKKSHTKGSTQRAVLCYERTPHIYHEQFDLAWGCGHVGFHSTLETRGLYRNFLITCAALMDQQLQTLYFPLLDDRLPPSVRNLQHWLEDAWKHGYDDEGANHFKHELAGTKKKIGTGEIYVAFTSRKIPCGLVDFNIKKSDKGFSTLVEWVVKYFTEKPDGDVNKILRTASPVVATSKMPIIMQYDGHSVTIVGYELAKSGKYKLLVFDPSSKISKDIRQAALNVSTSVDCTFSTPISLGKSKRRDRSKSPPKKRPRVDQDPDDGVVSISDSDDENADGARRAASLKSTLDPDTVIKAFRLKSLRNKHDFQLLYFTMGDPLSDEEQNDRKAVLSELEC